MITAFTGRPTRRSMLRGVGVGALGLAGAALFGCGSSAPASDKAGAAARIPVDGATSGGGLPMTAPKVAGKIKDGGTWTTASIASLKLHDAHTSLGASIWNYTSERMLEPDPNAGTIKPHVLTSWEVADKSGTTLVFKVHPKLFVHNIAPFNGRQFTAEDVAWNMMRIGGLYAEKLKVPLSSFQRATMVANIVKAEAVDPLTVKVTLSKPNSAFFNGLMENRTCLMPREMDDIGFKDPMKSAGIGAFQMGEWVNDQRAVYKKNPRYGEFRPTEPHFDEFRDIIVPDAASVQAAFISGQTSVVLVDTPESVTTVTKGKPDGNLYAWVDGNWGYLRPSYDYAPFKDFRVRKAISLAIDYAAIADGYYGAGWAYQASLNPGFPEAWKQDKVKALPGYNPATKAADRAEAQKMMAAAGFPNGKGIDFGVLFNRSTDFQVANVTRFQGQMATVFPEMKVAQAAVPDAAVFASRLAEGKFDMVGYTNTCVPDAVLEFTSQYHSQGSRNYGHDSNKDVDSLLDRAIVELNKEARTQMLDELQRRFMNEWMQSNVLMAQPKKFVLQGNIGGYDKVVGPWFQYSSNGQASRWYYIEK